MGGWGANRLPPPAFSDTPPLDPLFTALPTEADVHKIGNAKDVESDLDACFADLDTHLDPAFQKTIAEGSPKEFGPRFGRLIRPLEVRWGYTKPSKLFLDFENAGLADTDRAVAIILTAYIQKKRGQPITAEEEIEHYKREEEERWARMIEAAPEPLTDETLPDLVDREGHRATMTIPRMVRPARLPAYPEAMRRQGQECDVVVTFVVHKDGSTSDLRAVSGRMEFFEAIQQWLPTIRMLPALKNGRPKTVKLKMRFKFRLRGSPSLF